MVTSDEYWDKSSKLASEFGNALEGQAKSGKRKKRKSTGVKPVSDSRTFADIADANGDNENWFVKALETPVVKGALNLLGTPSSMVGNYTDAVTAGEERKGEIANKAADALAKGDKWGAALDLVSLLGPQAAVGPSVLKGLSAGIGQNENDHKSFSQTVKNFQQNANIDTENDAAKWTQGIGGFIGDVALDPSTYIGAGLAYHGVKGAVAGARDAGVAAKTAKLGGQVGSETNRLKGAVEGAKREVNEFRWDQYTTEQGKLAKKAAKRNPQSRTPYSEELQGSMILPGKLQKGEAFKLNASDLRKAEKDENLFRTSVIKDDKVAVESADLLKKLVGDEIDPLAGEVAFKSVAKAAESAPVGQIDTLAKPKTEMTIGETVMLSPAPKANVKSIPDADVVVPAAKIIDDIPSELKVADYQNYTPVDRFVLGTEYLTVNKTVGDVTKQTGQYSDIFKALRVGAVDPESSEKFLGFMRSFSEKPDMDMAEAVEKASEFVKTNSEAIQKSSRSFAPTAINGRLVKLNKAAGTDPSIAIMKTLPSENVNQYRIPLPPEQADALLGEMLEKSKADIINGILPAETAQILDKVFTKHFNEYSTPSGPYTTNTGWGTSTRRLIDGDPKKETWWTTSAAIDLFGKLNREISAALKKTNLKGPAYNAAKDDIFMRVAQNVDVTLKGHGIFPYLTDVMPDGGTAIRASMYDVLEAMGPVMRQKYIHVLKGSITNLRVTQAMNVGEMLMRSILGHNADGTLNFALIKPDTIRTLKGEFRNVADEQGIVRAINENLAIADQGFNEGIIKANIKNYNNATKARDTVYDAFFDDFVRVGEDGLSPVQKLGETVLRNTSLHSTKMSHMIIMAKKEALERLQTAIDVGSVGQFSKQIGDIVSVKSVHNPEAAEVLNKEIANVKREFVTPVEEMLINAQKEIERLSAGKGKSAAKEGKELLPNGKPKSTKWVANGHVDPNQKYITKANVKATARTTDPRLAPEDWVRLMNEGGSDQVVSLVQKDLAFGLVMKAYPSQKMWNRTFGMKHSYPAITGGSHIGTHLETAFHNQLNDFARNFKSEEINQAFKTIQNYDGDILKYIKENPQHGLPPVVSEMGRLMDSMFGVGTNNFYSRNGVTARHMNDILNTQTHVPSEWRFDPNASPAEMADSWKAWTNVKNPLNAMAAVHTAMVKAAGDITMGAKFTHFFGKTWKTIPVGERSHWAKVDIGNNAFGKLIDTDLYYPKEIIDELPALGKLITESRIFKNENLQKWVSQVFDPITSALKLTQTTMKPGHHIMSVQGDMLRNSLAGMNFSTKEYKHSWRILRARRKMVKELDGLDDYARLKTVAGNVTAEDNGLKGVALTINGREVSLSDDTLYQMFEQRDIYLPVHSAGVTEDLLTSPTGDFLEDVTETGIFKGAAKVSKGINEGATRLTNNKVIQLNQFSADRDNFMRGALALHFMQSKNFKSIDEALEYASKNIKKWAPTAKDLTAAEAKSARRVIFYYTWLRGILPRVIESSVKRPGWAVMPSKAMYNLAVANGIDPQSLGDPFPEEEMFPEYYRNGVLGPTWKTDDSGDYWGFNPTSPVMDVMNSLGSGVSVSNLTRPFAEDSGEKKLAGTLMGMVHPAFRSPIELGTGKSLSTGAPIIDSRQYLTDMIGPARFVSKITGHTISPNGGIPRRTEAKFKNGIEEEDWANNAGLEIFNYLTGAKVTNYTSDAATKSAEFDLKDKERLAKTESTRTEWWK